MIFITPIPHTKREIAPITPRKYVNIVIVDCKVSTKLANELTEKSASSVVAAHIFFKRA
jgi:hypothetical protein